MEAYLDAVRNESTWADCSNLSVVYTPLNGTGNIPVRKILDMIGVKQINIVKEQEQPDGNFPTCPYPNPEKKEALARGLALCEKLSDEGNPPDLLLATDPECDRVGIAVRHRDNTTGEDEFSLSPVMSRDPAFRLYFVKFGKGLIEAVIQMIVE